MRPELDPMMIPGLLGETLIEKERSSSESSGSDTDTLKSMGVFLGRFKSGISTMLGMSLTGVIESEVKLLDPRAAPL